MASFDEAAFSPLPGYYLSDFKMQGRRKFPFLSPRICFNQTLCHAISKIPNLRRRNKVFLDVLWLLALVEE